MRELPIGGRMTIECVKANCTAVKRCQFCVFRDQNNICRLDAEKNEAYFKCDGMQRADKTNVYYREVQSISQDALTTDDIRTIVNIADLVLNETSKKDLLTMGENYYYNSVRTRVEDFWRQEKK